MRVLMSVLGNRILEASQLAAPLRPLGGSWKRRSLKALKAVPGACETSDQVMTCHTCGSSGVTGHSPGNEIELASCRRVLWSRGRGRGRGQSNAAGRSQLLWAAVFTALLTTGASGSATAGTGRLRGLAARSGNYDAATFRPEGIRRGARGQNAASIAGYEEIEQPSMLETAISSARGAIEQVRNGYGPGMHRPPRHNFGLPPPPSPSPLSQPLYLTLVPSLPPPISVPASGSFLPKLPLGFGSIRTLINGLPQSNHTLPSALC